MSDMAQTAPEAVPDTGTETVMNSPGGGVDPFADDMLTRAEALSLELADVAGSLAGITD